MYEAVALAAEKYGDKFPSLIAYMEQLAATQKAAMDSAFNREAVASFNVLAESTRNSLKGIQTASEGLGIGAMFEAASEASATLAANMNTLQGKLGTITNPKDINEAQAQLTNLAETQRKLWAGVGESISKSLGDAFGNAGKAAGAMLMISVNAGQTESKLAQNKAKALKDIASLQGAGIDRAAMIGKVEVEYAQKGTQANIKMYGDMAGAAKGFFDEKSTGYKVLTGIEQAMHLLEMANMAESLYLTLTTEAAKNTAKVPGVIMSFMSWLGPWGAAAAAVAIGAVLGGAFGGGGGGLASSQAAQKQRIETQGTGTVLGDSSAKSNSIPNSLELIAKYTFEELEYSNKMLTAMQNLVAGLTGVSKSLVLTQGLMSGSALGTTEQAMPTGLLSGLLGGSSTTITGSGINVNGTLGQLASGKGSAQGYETVHEEDSGALFGLFGGGSSDSTKPFELGKDFKEALTLAYSNVRAGLVEVGSSLGLGANALTDQLNNIQSDITVENSRA